MLNLEFKDKLCIYFKWEVLILDDIQIENIEMNGIEEGIEKGIERGIEGGIEGVVETTEEIETTEANERDGTIHIQAQVVAMNIQAQVVVMDIQAQVVVMATQAQVMVMDTHGQATVIDIHGQGPQSVARIQKRKKRLKSLFIRC